MVLTKQPDLSISYRRMADLPTLIRALCYAHDAWVVGSGAAYLLNLKNDAPRDWDILVPFWTWGIACKLIPQGSVTNSHGGIKLISDGIEVDVWAGDVGWFLGQVPKLPAYAVHPRTMRFLVAGNDVLRDK